MKTILRCLFLTAVVVLLSSCRTSRPARDYNALARASIKLGFDIDMNDNQALYVESAKWISVPYRAGGTTKSGVDCSGLTVNIYKSVYRYSLPRSSAEQYNVSERVSKRHLQEGDLVFFSTDGRRKRVSHVGIYLKGGRFIHSSTGSGVIVSNLSERYYTNNWISGGRIQ